MIVVKGTWKCFRCGKENYNQILQCPNCKDTRKHSENMFRDLGFNLYPKQERERYAKIKEKLERFIIGFFQFALNQNIFKDSEGNIKNSEDTLYYGFDSEKHHYTIRRDEFKG